MRILMLLSLLTVGCGQSQTSQGDEKKNGKDGKPAGQSGGNPSLTGVVQNVRGAVNRTVTQAELKSLHLYIDTASGASGEMPTIQQITTDVSSPTGDRKLAAALQDGSIVLTGTRTREGIWAYEKNALTAGGMVVKSDGIERMTAEQLKKALTR